MACELSEAQEPASSPGQPQAGPLCSRGSLGSGTPRGMQRTPRQMAHCDNTRQIQPKTPLATAGRPTQRWPEPRAGEESSPSPFSNACPGRA